VTQDEWPDRLTQVVAGEVRRRRRELKMTAQQLADRCTELGSPLHRSVIANLENGRRPLVSVAELIILARALDVPPVLLIAPVGRRETIEILPGREAPSAWDAALWFSGEVRLEDAPAGLEARWAYEDSVIPLYHQHDAAIADVTSEGDWERLIRDDDAREKAAVIREIAAEDLKRLRGIRSAIRGHGLTPPRLPAGLAYVDEGTGRARRT
jgi:transcriptional regulator with XRE-family HTH domain